MRNAASGWLTLARLSRHSCHWRLLWAKASSTRSRTSFLLLGDRADAQCFDEPGVALFLPGNHLIDYHGTAGRDGFLDHRAAGLADDEMVRHEQARHLIGPAIDVDAAAKLAESARSVWL